MSDKHGSSGRIRGVCHGNRHCVPTFMDFGVIKQIRIWAFICLQERRKQLYLYLGYCIRQVRFIFRALLSVIYFVLNMGWRNYIFELPKESENSIRAFVKTILFPMLFSHYLSFRFVRNHSELSIFNSFNFVACEFSVESFPHGNFPSI